MKTTLCYLHLIVAITLGVLASPLALAQTHDHDHSHATPAEKEVTHAGEVPDHHSVGEEENVSHIDDAMAQQVGIGTTLASSQTIRQSITSYGVLTTGAEQLSHMRARFPGLITSVNADIGDSVSEGDLLAEVESDESLKKYSVRAPIAGTIVQRHANTGEVTKDQILFSIANFDALWVELRIYPSQRERVFAGQTVEIISDERRFYSQIRHIIPGLDKPYQLARVALNNRELGLSPGLLVEGLIVIDEFDVPLAVEKQAIQQLGGRSGVFIQERESYRFTPLILGRADERYVEVLGGLRNEQRYVNRNSYLIKADIEKSEADHDH